MGIGDRRSERTCRLSKPDSGYQADTALVFWASGSALAAV